MTSKRIKPKLEAKDVWADLDLKVDDDSQLEVIYESDKHETTFGAFVSEFVKERESSIVGLAKDIGVSKQTMFDWINAKSIPSVKHSIAILNALKCPVDRLEEALKDNFLHEEKKYFNRIKQA